jgi:hypothetical protein
VACLPVACCLLLAACFLPYKAKLIQIYKYIINTKTNEKIHLSNSGNADNNVSHLFPAANISRKL